MRSACHCLVRGGAINELLAAIVFVPGLALGWLTAWLICRRRISRREQRIRGLEISLTGRETSLLDIDARLQEQEANVARLRRQISRDEKIIHNLTTCIRDQNRAVARLELAVKERNTYIKALRAYVRDVDTTAGGLETSFGHRNRTGGTSPSGPRREIGATEPPGKGNREREDHDRALPASLVGEEQQLLELNGRLLELVWTLETRSNHVIK